ncbi:hypothetical protein [Streptomyces adustus]|uniref:hypothetical protein n=1 Tax=Streptomyces adustus TaxID=1609272 RepID=UPI003718420E
MTSTPEQPTAPFSRIKIRTGALVFCGDEVALIRRDRAGYYEAPMYRSNPGRIHNTVGRRTADAAVLAEAVRLFDSTISSSTPRPSSYSGTRTSSRLAAGTQRCRTC